MNARVLAPTLLATLLAAGCIYAEPGPADVRGELDGYSPTPSFLKVNVRNDAGETTLVSFDRRDWHVTELARRIDSREIRQISVHGMERSIPGEVLAQRVIEPEALNALRFETMGASADERRVLDAEYDLLVEAYAEAAARAPTVAPTRPTLELPDESAPRLPQSMEASRSATS